MDIKQLLIYGNTKFYNCLTRNQTKLEHLDGLLKGQHPVALIITCSDSRVIPEEIFSADFGSLFVIRTAGNVINEGELASVEYGLDHLHIKFVLVLGHTNCGAVHAAIHDEKGKYLSPIINRLKKNIGEEKDECLASQKNAIETAKYIKELFPECDGKVESALYNLETRKVEFL